MSFFGGQQLQQIPASLEQRIAELEAIRKPIVAGRTGNTTLKVISEAALAGGPSITVPQTGLYEVELSLEGISQAPGLVDMLGNLAINGVPQITMFDFVTETAFARVRTSTTDRLNLVAGQVLSIRVQIAQNVECTFLAGRLSLLKVE